LRCARRRFSAFMVGAAGKKQAAEVELLLVRPPVPDAVDVGASNLPASGGGGGCLEWAPVALRIGSEGAWTLALPDPPCEGDVQLCKTITAAGLAKSHAGGWGAGAGGAGALGLLMTTAFVCLGEAGRAGGGGSLGGGSGGSEKGSSNPAIKSAEGSKGVGAGEQGLKKEGKAASKDANVDAARWPGNAKQARERVPSCERACAP